MDLLLVDTAKRYVAMHTKQTVDVAHVEEIRECQVTGVADATWTEILLRFTSPDGGKYVWAFPIESWQACIEQTKKYGPYLPPHRP